MSRGVRVPVGTDGRPVGRDTELVALLAAYQDAVVRSAHLDPVTTELVRLRCARQHDCRICQTLRLATAAQLGVDAALTDQIDHYESSDLSERHKVALRIVDAFIWRPTDIGDALVEQAHAHFSPEEIAELVVDITKWSTQKIHVALGTDGADRLPVNDQGISYLSFGDDGRVTAMSAHLG
jgi:alkylhydroperoxidase family enzyme